VDDEEVLGQLFPGNSPLKGFHLQAAQTPLLVLDPAYELAQICPRINPPVETTLAVGAKMAPMRLHPLMVKDVASGKFQTILLFNEEN